MTGLKPGDRVQLKWNGYRGVPLVADMSLATVKRVKRTRVLLVDCDALIGEVDVRFDQILRRVDE